MDVCTPELTLQHFELENEVIIECDIFDYVSAGLLWQKSDVGELHLVVYDLKISNLSKQNYDIYNKEIIVIAKALEEWTPKWDRAVHMRPLPTETKNLGIFQLKEQCQLIPGKMGKEYIQIELSNRLSTRKMPWVYGVIEMMGRKPTWGGDERLKLMEQVVLRAEFLPKQLCILANDISQDKSIPHPFHQVYEKDSFPNKVV
jgi:hypothetical protein